ncbi:hypothetical protein [Streptomyces sp. NPDC091209]|uniref:hypothetical protein n=1 Tax=Streptomyces sp. NPDC091209 TaxID=3365974 RepID=UPI003813F6DF
MLAFNESAYQAGAGCAGWNTAPLACPAESRTRSVAPDEFDQEYSTEQWRGFDTGARQDALGTASRARSLFLIRRRRDPCTAPMKPANADVDGPGRQWSALIYGAVTTSTLATLAQMAYALSLPGVLGSMLVA